MVMREIIERCQHGEQQAFGSLYTTMRPQLLAVCHRYVADPSTCEDLLHDSFLLIISKIGELRDTTKASRWMRTVTKNVALYYVQEQKRRSEVPIDEVQEHGETAQTVTPVPLTYDELMHAVDTLPAGYRQVFRLSVLEGLTHQEIAALLHIEPHTSSSQLYRARHLLQQSLRGVVFLLIAALLPLGYWLFSRRQSPEEQPQTAQSERTPAVETAAKQVVRPVETAQALPHRSRPKAETTVPPADSCTVEKTLKAEQHSESHEVHHVTMTEDNSLAEGQPDRLEEPMQSLPHHDASGWSLALAYNSLPDGNYSGLPHGEYGMNVSDSVARHHMPLTIGFELRRRISEALSLDLGVHYTWLTSEFEIGTTYSYMNREQHLGYLGFSAGASYRLPFGRSCGVYASLSAACELPMHASQRTSYYYDHIVLGSERTTLKPAAQWSVGAGLGVECQLLKGISLFAEPRLQYHFPTGDGIDTWRTEHRFTLSVPIGIRITFINAKDKP